MLISPGDWGVLRSLRLAALRDSPKSFLSQYKTEARYTDEAWASQFERGDWYGAFSSGKPVGLLGATREPDRPGYERHLEYLWVRPDHRRCGIASALVSTALSDFRAAGVRTVYLWVLNHNEHAFRLYERLGFSSTGKKNDLSALKPGRTEEQMFLDLR